MLRVVLTSVPVSLNLWHSLLSTQLRQNISLEITQWSYTDNSSREFFKSISSHCIKQLSNTGCTFREAKSIDDP